MATALEKSSAKRSASWPREHHQILVNLWREVSKQFDFSRSPQYAHAYQQRAKLAAWGIHRTGDQCRTQIKTNYWKARDANHTSGNMQSSCPLHEESHEGLGTVPSTEPPAFHNSLASQDGNPLAPEPITGPEGSQLALPEQLQATLDPYSEELFDAPLAELPATEPASEKQEAEVASEPGPFRDKWLNSGFTKIVQSTESHNNADSVDDTGTQTCL
ncbi:hypothetical protein UY3_08689 [Chelonia mydas]|uniref:Myb/SANT-like DNA-binding domain-containing protein n=1 Tax=Chelonia mydas TaxID=8469 RepID=M7BAJ6_CHEMY|nr:hypothetical protein UY3_08689 [Chelonia mydas]